MSAVSGNYVSTFAEATHALPKGMHMNADYPFMLPKILLIVADCVVLEGRDGPGTFAIRRDEKGREHVVIEQVSSFERVLRRPPTRFRAYPFKDERTGLPSEKAKP